MSEFQTVDLPSIADSRGVLTVMQDVLPFEVKRTFWITHADGGRRGGHRHQVTRLALAAVAGCVDVYLNDGHHEKTVRLDHPARCLLVEPDDWHTMSFGEGAVLLIFASTKYDAADYITTPYVANAADD